MIDIFLDEQAAAAFVEARRWPEVFKCPHCATPGRTARLPDSTTRRGVFKCYACRKFFTHWTGTVLEGSHLDCVTLLSAIMLIVASRGQIGTSALTSSLGVTAQTVLNLRARLGPALPHGHGDTREGAGALQSAEDVRLKISQTLRLQKELASSESIGPRQARQRRRLALLEALIADEARSAFEEALDRLLARTAMPTGAARSSSINTGTLVADGDMGAQRTRVAGPE